MHEMKIAQSILDQIEKTAARLSKHRINGCLQAERVHVAVGEFRNVDPESLKFAFASLRNLYLSSQSCQLIVDLIETTAQCQANKHVYHPTLANRFCCHECGSGIGELLSGQELEITDTVFTASASKEIFKNAQPKQ